MNPSLLGSRQFDGAAYVDGLELIQELGTTTLSGGKPIFVSLNNISIFSSLESECKNTNHAPILLIDQTFPPVSMYTDRIRELREFGYHFAIRNLPVHCYEEYAPILSQMDYILIDCQKIDAVKASFYFRKLYPDTDTIRKANAQPYSGDKSDHHPLLSLYYPGIHGKHNDTSYVNGNSQTQI